MVVMKVAHLVAQKAGLKAEMRAFRWAGSTEQN